MGNWLKMLTTSDFGDLRIGRLTLCVGEGKANAKIVHILRNEQAFDITMWLWLSGGVWRSGWAITRSRGVVATSQLEERVKGDLQKLLISYFESKKL